MKKMKNRKGSVQLTESILVMFFILVIIAMSLVIFYRFQINSLNNYENEYRDKQMLSMLMVLPNELGYSFLGKSENAIDTSKLFNPNLDYGFKTIIVEQIYPEFNGVVECTIVNYPNCNQFIVYDKPNVKLKNTLIESRPVSLYYPLDGKFRAGKLIIKWYY